MKFQLYLSLWKVPEDEVRTTFHKNIRLLERTGKKRLILGIINFANHLIYLTENLQFSLSVRCLYQQMLDVTCASENDIVSFSEDMSIYVKFT